MLIASKEFLNGTKLEMPNCCTECFLDDYLKKLIKEEDTLGKCSFCGSENVYLIDPQELQGYFDPLINLYTAQVEFYPIELLKECEGRFIWEILAEDWGVFDDSEIGKAIIEEMYEGDSKNGLSPDFLDNYVDREDEWYGVDKQLSDKLRVQWNEFCEEITYKNRFFPQKKLDVDLLSEILTYSDSIITTGEFLFRARLSPDGILLPATEIGAPPKQKAIEGRANPKWIPYLYLASDSDTAVSEVRSQVHNTITVGKFKVNNKISVIDLRNPYIDNPFMWGDRLAFVLDIYNFLRLLGDILSKPVDRDKTTIEYLPTQYLCEFIKNQGFEGILYKSFLGSGHNIVLFGEDKVDCIETKLYKVASIKVESEEVIE
ncbi:MAG TPA: RES domain-containing protein [Desulfosporosinus sp.]|nr:RES domain-containing protein [Desulfosporosinus sp.]